MKIHNNLTKWGTLRGVTGGFISHTQHFEAPYK